MENIQKISQKIGFWQTLRILSLNHFNPISLKEFYKQLNEKSYYNAFYRIKEFLIEHGIITIYESNKIKMIGLKSKGLTLLNHIYAINNILEGDWIKND